MDNHTLVIANDNLSQPAHLDQNTDNLSERTQLLFQERLTELENQVRPIRSELFRYPTLAQALRQLPDFPWFKKMYPLHLHTSSKTQRGHYDDCIRDFFNAFYEALSRATTSINHWFFVGGKPPAIPIIESFTLNQNGWVEQCVINGLAWEISSSPTSSDHPARFLDLHALSIDHNWRIQVEDAIPGSPLLALVVQNPKGGHKPRLFWYNLHTRRPGHVTDAARY